MSLLDNLKKPFREETLPVADGWTNMLSGESKDITYRVTPKKKSSRFMSRKSTNQRLNDTLFYIKEREGQPIDVEDMQRRFKYAHPSSVRNHINALLRKKAIRRTGGDMRNGYTYEVLVGKVFNKKHRVPTEMSPPKVQKIETAEDNNNKQLIDTIETLVLHYVEDTRSIDVLQFITWLEKKSKE